MTSIYDFKVSKQDGSLMDLTAYQGKVLLLVNTATGCGLTSQYQGLQKLYTTYRDQGFEVLDFPCNQFKEQAPGSDEEINQFCSLNYQTDFPRFKKIEVNGEGADPLFNWLKKEKPDLLGQSIKWNFTKFLVDREGKVFKRFSPYTEPENIARFIEKLL